MNKNQTLTALTLSTALLALPVWAGQGPNPNAGAGSGVMLQDCTAYEGVMPTEAEAQSLVFMVEEEKVARDLYSAFYDTWQLPIFYNIALAEQQHMSAIECLISKYDLIATYNLAIPDAEVGFFSDLNLQNLYNDLYAAGQVSATAALETGALVEETDISDLQNAITELADDNPDIAQIYNNLMSGSRNHLRSFVGLLEFYYYQDGAEYVPQVLDQAAYDEIIAGEMERGNGQGQGGPAAGAGNGNAGGRGRGF